MSAVRSGGQARKPSLATVLAAAFSGLMLLTLLLVLGPALWVGVRNTTELLTDKGRLTLELLRQRVDDHLAPAEALVAFVGRRVETGELSPERPEELADALRYTLAAAPQVEASGFLSAAGWLLVLFRNPAGRIETARTDWRKQDAFRRAALAIARRGRPEAFWGDPIFSPTAGETFLYFARPVYRDGIFEGAVVASMSVDRLSLFLDGLGPDIGGEAFILYGREQVLAHPALAGRNYGRSPEKPLPRLRDVGDPVLAAIWSPGYEQRRLQGPIAGHVATIDGRAQYFYLHASLEERRQKPWLLVAAFPANVVAAEMHRLRDVMVIGALVLLAGLAATIWLARRIARPVTALALASGHVAALELDRVQRLGASRIRELDRAARAFNGMVAGIASFARYVPRELVRRLMATGESERPEKRELTILFTDLAGFTNLSEALDAAEVAALLERHYALLGRSIVEEQGTIDKFVGDGVLAFWGAPERLPDHAERALRAARAIARAHLRSRHRNGFLPLRIGIHSGEAIVGEITTPARTTYTVVGDAVNTASRLERMAGELLEGGPVCILVSETTAKRLRCRLVDLGLHPVRGRERPLRLFTLPGDVSPGPT